MTKLTWTLHGGFNLLLGGIAAPSSMTCTGLGLPILSCSQMPRMLVLVDFFAGHWFLGGWLEALANEPIMVREMYPIAMCCFVWGKEWSNKRLLFHSDNESVVCAWKKGSCRNKSAMALIRCMLAIAARHNFILYIQHVAGINNDIADALSRFQVSRFRRLAPKADA